MRENRSPGQNLGNGVAVLALQFLDQRHACFEFLQSAGIGFDPIHAIGNVAAQLLDLDRGGLCVLMPFRGFRQEARQFGKTLLGAGQQIKDRAVTFG